MRSKYRNLFCQNLKFRFFQNFDSAKISLQNKILAPQNHDFGIEFWIWGSKTIFQKSEFNHFKFFYLNPKSAFLIPPESHFATIKFESSVIESLEISFFASKFKFFFDQILFFY